MTDKSKWRAEKNEKIIAAREKRDAANKDSKQPTHDQQGNPLPGTPGHWKYKKEQGIKHGTTTAKDLAPKEAPKEPNPPGETIDPEEPKIIIYNRDELFRLNKLKQVELIAKYTTETAPKYERDRVDLILKLQKE